MTLSRLLKRFASLNVLDAEVARVNDDLRRLGSATAYVQARRSAMRGIGADAIAEPQEVLHRERPLQVTNQVAPIGPHTVWRSKNGK